MSNWLCYHFFYHDDQNRPIVNLVNPLVETLRSSHGLINFFFLRYWNGGPHLRLRFLFEEQDHNQERQLFISRYIAKFLKDSPSSTPMTSASYAHMASGFSSGENSEVESFYGDNVLKKYPYEPEYRKYGGAQGVVFAEKVFAVSSALVIRTLSSKPNKSRVLAEAIISMATGLQCLGFDQHETQMFMSRYRDFWSEYSKRLSTGNASFPPLQNQQSMSTLLDNIINKGKVFEYMNAWALVFKEMQATLGISIDKPEERKQIEFYVTNYFHTHNNRLGILSLEEAYLGYIGYEAISGIDRLVEDE